MQKTDERVRHIQQRTRLLRQKRYRYTKLGCMAACFVCIVGLGITLPTLTISSTTDTPVLPGTASALADIPANLSYILMGILSFLLGICVTLLLIQLRKQQKWQDEPEEETFWASFAPKDGFFKDDPDTVKEDMPTPNDKMEHDPPQNSSDRDAGGRQ